MFLAPSVLHTLTVFAEFLDLIRLAFIGIPGIF